MVVSCEQVWREISNYLDGEMDPALRAAVEEHVRGCKNCTAVVDGTRNIIQLFGDERLLEVPSGYAKRLHQRLAEDMPQPRGNALGWLLAVAAAALVAGSLAVGNSSAFTSPEIRSKLAKPAFDVPANLMVAVSDEGKTFHVPGCKYLHDKERVRMMTAGEAVREGYVPCVRCMRKYLSLSERPTHTPENKEASLVELDDN